MLGLTAGHFSNQRVRLAALVQPFRPAFETTGSAAHIGHRQEHTGGLAALVCLHGADEAVFEFFGFIFEVWHLAIFQNEIAIAQMAKGD